MTSRRQLLLGSFAATLAAGCKGSEPTPEPGLPGGPLDADAMGEAMLEVFEGGYAEEVAELLAGLEELRVLIEPELPVTAALITVGFNELGVPLVQGLAAARDAGSMEEAVEAMGAFEERARAGMATLQWLLPQVDEETAGLPEQAAEADLSPLQEGLAASHDRFESEVRLLEVHERPSIRSLQATQHTEARRISAGDVTLRDDLDLALRLSEVAAAAPEGAKGLFGTSDCGELEEAKFWYTVGSALWKLAALMGLALGGWSLMSGITATLAVALLGGIFSLQFIWLLLIVLFTIQLALKLNSILETLDACACELRGEP